MYCNEWCSAQIRALTRHTHSKETRLLPDVVNAQLDMSIDLHHYVGSLETRAFVFGTDTEQLFSHLAYAFQRGVPPSPILSHSTET
jgi:hypothetical protein